MQSNTSGQYPEHSKIGGASSNKKHGVFIGKIKDNVDPEGLGRLRVWISQLSASKESDERSWFTVRYCPPFAGAENSSDEAKGLDSTKVNDTNKSYGFWAVPPHKNVNVLCSFINGESTQGVWWACLPHDGHTHSLPGLAGGQTHDGKVSIVSERNRFNSKDAQSENRPEHPLTNNLKNQGTEKDLLRGMNNAGPFRNKDKHPGYAYGFVSPAQHQILIDDGEDGNSGQIKLRVNTGASITIDAKSGFINIINSTGSAWMEIDADGNIDVYSEKDYSVGVMGNINLSAGGQVNIEAAGGINMAAAKNMTIESCEVLHITGMAGTHITSGQQLHILADSSMKVSASRVDINGPKATRATLPGTNSLVTNSVVGTSITSRVPEKEPWGGHSQRFGEQITIPSGKSELEPVITPAPDSFKEAPPPEETNAIACIPTITDIVMSESGFNLLISREAYRGMMYSDVRGYSVGYGTRVDIFGPSNPASKLDAAIKQSLISGPSEIEARLASRQIIDKHVTPYIISALKKSLALAGKQVCITQSQVDALIMAAYGNPSAAIKMAALLVESGAKTSDGKPTNEDIATIWANSRYNNSADYKNSDARYAMIGKPNAGTRSLSQDRLREQGVKSDLSAIKNNKAANPSQPWDSALGGGPKGTQTVAASYGAPSAQQKAQFERSYYLNTGNVAPTSNLTTAQLRDKYGVMQVASNAPNNTATPSVNDPTASTTRLVKGNSPPGTPTQAA